MLRLGLPPAYVLDGMRWYEIAAAFKYAHLAHRDGWEQARLVAATSAAPWAKNKWATLNEFMPLPWEAETAAMEHKPLTAADKKRLKELQVYGKRLYAEAESRGQRQRRD